MSVLAEAPPFMKQTRGRSDYYLSPILLLRESSNHSDFAVCTSRHNPESHSIPSQMLEKLSDLGTNILTHEIESEASQRRNTFYI